VSFLNALSKHLLIMELCFDAMLYSHWLLKILMRTVSNVHTGRRIPNPAVGYGP